MKRAVQAALAACSVLALGSVSASAAIVCNGDGDCWHVKKHHDFRPGLKLKVYPDNWKWRQTDASHYRWREHDGNGYWHGGVWVNL